MEKEKLSKWQTFKNYIKYNILFRVSKEKKNYIKQKVMNADHHSYVRMLVLIFALQTIMIIYTCVKYQMKFEDYRLWYLICYIALAVVSVVCLLLILYLHQNQNYKGYFIVATIVVNAFFIWGAAITIIDSFKFSNLTTYSYVTLAAAAFVILEPWVFIVDTVGYTVLLNIAFVCIKRIQYSSSIIISSISIAILTMLAAIINFRRRIRDIELQKEVSDLNDVLQLRAYKDVLTGVYNRRYLTEHINDALHIGMNPSAAILFDIDDFKKVNDTYGHQAGDMCLVELGNVIRQFVDKTPNSYAVRYGGEEFLIFIPHIKQSDAIQLADDLCHAVAETEVFLPDETILNIHISIGLAIAKGGINYSSLINLADDNLYEAKNNGKNQVVFK